MGDELSEEDPLTAVVVPEYIGKKSEELEGEIESKFSGNRSDGDTSDQESDG